MDKKEVWKVELGSRIFNNEHYSFHVFAASAREAEEKGMALANMDEEGETLETDIEPYCRSAVYLFEVVNAAADELAAQRAENEGLRQALLNIVNGDYNNARTIDAAEKHAREALARLLADAASVSAAEVEG